MLADPAAATQCQHDLAVETARRLQIDILERGGVAQPTYLQAPGELALPAVRPLGVDEKPNSFLEAELRPLTRSEVLLEGFGGRVHLHGVHLVDASLA